MFNLGDADKSFEIFQREIRPADNDIKGESNLHQTSEARFTWGSYVLARTSKDDKSLMMYEVVEPTKPAIIKNWAVNNTATGDSWFDIDPKKMRFPLLVLVFGITAWY